MDQILDINVDVKIKGVYTLNIAEEMIKLPNTIDTKLKQLFANQLVSASNILKMDLNVDDGISLSNDGTAIYIKNQVFRGGAGKGGSFSISQGGDASGEFIQLFGDLLADTDTSWSSIISSYPDILEAGYGFSAGSFADRISSITGFDSKFDTGVRAWTAFWSGDAYIPIIWELNMQGTEIDNNYFSSRLLQGMRFTGNADKIRLNYLSNPDTDNNSLISVFDQTNTTWRSAEDQTPTRITTDGGDGTLTWVKFTAQWENDTGGNVTIIGSEIGKGDIADAETLLGFDYKYAVKSGLSRSVSNGAILTVNWTFNF